ncbi:MAG: 4Fe-4S binding protein, partial [Armatimonadetes bacterium]|nr:4Fe-4S binding protein [Armatimonadota bacterium]
MRGGRGRGRGGGGGRGWGRFPGGGLPFGDMGGAPGAGPVGGRRPLAKVDASQCVGCGRCVDICPQRAISLNDSG